VIWLYAALGAAAASLQAALLRRSARQGEAPFGVLLRLLLVGGALTVGALGGQLLPTAVGWACTFAVLSFGMAWRWS